MKTLQLLLLLFVFSISVAQEDSQNNLNEYTPFTKFRFGGGIYLTQKKLNKFIGNSPFVEIDVNFPLKRKRSFDLAFQFVIPENQERFKFARVKDTLTAKSTLLFNGFIRFNKEIISHNKKALILSNGLGVSTITTDLRNPYYSGKEKENKYEFISSILLAPGLHYSISSSNYKNFKIGIEYLYTPYKTEGALLDNIGKSAIAAKFTYQF